MVRIVILSITVLILLNACGLTKSTEQAANAANATLSKVDESNELQQKILAKNNQLADLTGQLVALNNQINASTDKTKLAIHQQILGNSLDGLLDPSNTEDVKTPTKMVPYGKSFAEEATELEIMATCDLLLNDAKNGEGGLTALKKKMVDLTAVGIIAGLTPKAKFTNIMNEQVDSRGEYEETAYEYAMLRYMFIRDGILRPIIEKKTVLNKSLLLKTRDAFLNLKQIAQLPYASRIGITVSAIFYSQSLNTSEISSLAQKARDRFNQVLPKSLLNDAEVVQALSDFSG